MIYFDNSATTPLCPQAKAAMVAAMEEYANPSSVHEAGFLQEQRMEQSRRLVAGSLGCAPQELVFTGSGTEADNLAIFGTAEALGRRGKGILTTDSEHPAVARAMDRLEQQGFAVCRVSTRGGVLDLQQAQEFARRGDLILATVMHTNNETGARYPVKDVFDLVRRTNPLCVMHTDCVQAYGKEEIGFARLGADLISVSAHKIHGPKGIGALAVKKGVRLVEQICGGGQERGLRSGTQNTVAIAGFGAAAQRAAQEMGRGWEQARALGELMRRELAGRVEFLQGSGSFSPYIVSLRIPGAKSEVALRILSDQGVCVSAGSACSAKTGKSPVLKAFGLTDRQADATLRISFGAQNTPQEVQAFCQIVKSLRF